MKVGGLFVQVGMYVRCPIIKEEADELYPRMFVMGQIIAIDDFAEEIKVRIHDLFKCKAYYPEVFAQNTFKLRILRRNKAPTGYKVLTSKGWGKITAILPNKHVDTEFYQYYIELDGCSSELFIEKDISIDFSQTDFSPLQQLKDYEFQNPSWYASRFVVSNTNHVLDNAVYGFRTLAGCRVFLLPHQIVTIIRCLETQPVRYMLADEVGLGKTIEACGIIKILETQNSNLQVLYVIPFALIDQWKNELFYKFNIKATVYNMKSRNSRHVIIPMNELPNHQELLGGSNKWDVVLVDETHRLLQDEAAYKFVKKLSMEADNILLLSATPIQDRKQEYLSLLTLLSPELYGEMSMDKFELLVEKQKKIQRKIHSIVDDVQQYVDYAESIKNRLVQLAIELDDEMLKKIISGINLDCYNRSLENTQQAIAYICEHYRLERRVVRNRREMLRNRMPSRKLVILPYQVGTADQLYDEAGVIETILNWIQENKFDQPRYIQDIAQPIISALFSSPWALEETLKEKDIKGEGLLNRVVGEWLRVANYELSQLDRILDEDPDLIRGRLVKVLDYIEQETDICKTDKPCKILVFTQFVATLDKFYKAAAHRFGEDTCTVFCAGLEREILEFNADAFQRDDACRLMICDELGGEGRNFQNADMIIHLDLPWTANALEQRIGRLDRLGRVKDHDVISVVVFAQNTIEEQLFTLWNEGMSLFTQSLSGLEIITGEVSERIFEALQEDIQSGLVYVLDDILDQMLTMRDGVEDEQLYDTEAMLFRPLTKVIEQMLSIYQGREDQIFASAMLSWASQAGLRPNNNKNLLVGFLEDDFSVASSNNALLIPPDWSIYERYPLVQRSGSIMGTFNRSLAIQREDILFYAPGDPIFEAIVQNALVCNRGRASVFVSKSPNIEFQGFLLIWNIEPDTWQLLKDGVNSQYLSQFRAYLPLEQIMTIYPLNKHSQSVKPEELKKFILNEEPAIRQAHHTGERRGFEDDQANIQKFMKQYPPDIWERVLNDVYNTCKHNAKEELNQLSDYNTALSEIRRIVQAYCASNLFFGRSDEENEKVKQIYKAVLRALKKPRLKLDSMALIKVVKTNEY